MKHAAIYSRVSTAEQTHASQIPDLNQWAEAHGGSTEWYSDTASGRTMQRPGWQRLAADIAVGRVAAVVVWRLDRLRAHLRQFIERIEVFAVGYQPGKWAEDAGEDSPPKARTTRRGKPVPHIPGPEAEDTLADGIADIAWDVAPGFARSPEFHGFLDYVRGLRQTKKAWFLRVHFKTGAMVDIVPTGSVASGMRLDEFGDRDQRWKHIEPDINKLWFAYRDTQRKEAKRVQPAKLVTTPC